MEKIQGDIMMDKIAFTKRAVTTLVFIFMLSACNNNPTGNDPGPPHFLNSELIYPDLTYFTETEVSGDSTEHFQSGKELTLEFKNTIDLGQAYLAFIAHVRQDPRSYSFKDEKWIWEFEKGFLGNTLTITVTAEEQNKIMIWEAFWNEEGTSGTTIEENKLFRGEVAKNDSLGSWVFYEYSPESDQQKLILFGSWERTGGISEENREIYFNLFNDDESISDAYVFERHGGNHFYFERSGQKGRGSVYWNTAPGDGYYNLETSSEERKCWRLYRDFKNTDCSEITHRSR